MKKALQQYCFSLFLPLCALAFVQLLSFGGQILYSELHFYPSVFLIRLKDVYLDHLPLLYAASTAFFMTQKKDAQAAFSGIISYLILTQIVDPDTLSHVLSLTYYDIHYSFSYAGNALSGILCGLLAAMVHQRAQQLRPPAALAFFSGRRMAPVITGLATILLAFLFYLLWPGIYTAFISLNFHLTQGGPLAEAASALINLMLTPIGMHDFAEQFIITADVQTVSSIFSTITFPCVLLLVLFQKRKQLRKIWILTLLLFISLFSPRNDLFLITLLLISPWSWLAHCLCFSLFCFLMAVFPDLLTPLAICFTALYLGITSWLLTQKKLEFPSMFAEKSYNDNMLMQFIHCMGDLENIRALHAEGTELTVDIYDPEMFDSSALQAISGWKAERSASSVILHTESDALTIQRRIEAISQKDQENLIL